MHIGRLFWQTLLWANWGIIALFWIRGSGPLLVAGLPFVLIALGRLAGLAAAYMILLQFFFMGRMPWLERVFGLDRLSRIHHTNGLWGLVLLLAHPVLLVAGYSMASGQSLWAQFTAFLFGYEHVMWALVGTILFVLVVASSVYIVRKRFRYESWYFVHVTAYLAVFSSFWHQLSVGEDILASRFFYGYWIALYAAVFGSHLVFRFARPLWLFARHRFTVDRIVRETPSTVSIYITGRAMERYRIRPGQFMIVRFFTRRLWWQAHPFSLSMMPNGRDIRITVKELGDFTKQVKHIAPGTSVLIDGPYGVFTDFFGISDRVLMIAGGIGITPIRSLIEDMIAKGRSVALIYGNRAEEDIAFKRELDALAASGRLALTHVLSDSPRFGGETGRVDAEKIERLVPDVRARDVYLCGPPAMMDAVIRDLRTLGVPPSRIHYERFSL